jgi:glycosyltransferase involved in cell wall biosynthesis
MLAPEFLPAWGGVGAYIVELVRHLPKETEIHVLTPWRTSLGSSAISTSDYDFSRYFGPNVRVHFITKASDTFVYNLNFQYACSRVVPKLVKEEGIDLVHSHAAHMSDLLLQFRKIKIPIITTIHTTIEGQREGAKSSGLPFSSLEASERWTYLTYPFLRLAETIYFLKRRNYVTVSHWMKNQVEKKYPILRNRVRVVHNATDTNRFIPAQRRSERKTILFTGRLISAKGIRNIVDAIPSVLQSFPETFFLFIGSGNASPYERKLRELEIPNDNYKFLGYLKEANDLVNYYQQSSIYVAPTMYENLPTRVLEAMACGTPVIASNVCGIPEAVHDGENGLLVEPGSTKQLADSICYLLGDHSCLQKMGQNARSTVLKEFDWRVSAAKISDIYKQVVNS